MKFLLLYTCSITNSERRRGEALDRDIWKICLTFVLNAPLTVQRIPFNLSNFFKAFSLMCVNDVVTLSISIPFRCPSRVWGLLIKYPLDGRSTLKWCHEGTLCRITMSKCIAKVEDFTHNVQMVLWWMAMKKDG